MRFRSRTTSRCRPLVSIEALPPLAHAGEMPLGRDALQLAELLLLGDEAARGVDVARHEDGDGEPQVIDGAAHTSRRSPPGPPATG